MKRMRGRRRVWVVSVCTFRNAAEFHKKGGVGAQPHPPALSQFATLGPAPLQGVLLEIYTYTHTHAQNDLEFDGSHSRMMDDTKFLSSAVMWLVVSVAGCPPPNLKMS